MLEKIKQTPLKVVKLVANSNKISSLCIHLCNRAVYEHKVEAYDTYKITEITTHRDNLVFIFVKRARRVVLSSQKLAVIELARH